MPQRRALIIGGSLGGLFAAHMLRAAGWDVDVYERCAEDLAGRGAGLGTHDALRDLMGRIGIDVETPLGVAIHAYVCRDRSGRAVNEIQLERVMSAWARLYRPLKDALPEKNYHPGMALEHVETDKRAATAIFGRGQQHTRVGLHGRRHLGTDQGRRYLLVAAIADVFVRAEQPFFQAIFDLASPRLVFGRVALLGDAAFVARPHVGAGVTKAALDAACLADATAAEPDLDAALAYYDRERRRFGDWIVARSRDLGACIAVSATSAPSSLPRASRPEYVMREYAALPADVKNWAAGTLQRRATAVSLFRITYSCSLMR
jgi:2-polyprenyl-6-methoxyphenol hydroxylase-like FAD-dependent oxidoreductase